MVQKQVSTPIVVSIIAVVAIAAVFFLYKGWTGGTVGDGHAGRIQAAPPMPNAQREQYIQAQMPHH